MFMRQNRMLIPLPEPSYADANAASAVQELLGGEFGEMSTLNNYMFQSFNFRDRKKFKPFYDLISSITAEEFGHVELVSQTINLMIQGTTHTGNVNNSPMQNAVDKRNSYHFIANAQTSRPMDSMGQHWTGKYVFNSGNLIQDLLHNYFLEIGARTHKMRVYEMTDNPVAREMIGYLLVRGGVHVLAYAKAIEVVSGVDMTKMLPVPDLSNDKFDTARKFEADGVHRRLYRFSEQDYKDVDKIWKGAHPDDGEPLEVIAGAPEGAPLPDLPPIPETFAPGVSIEDYRKILERLKRGANID
ncbi:Mn-containing catalase [Salsuginibacillus halophilus]|uniref:Mn-containing catalase n=1 Tax=Salsuginibacillus halophilus TaxID=517424 RepID=A0A2P8HWM6_9BACI|nr:manganese catalase family protein [Salsuginibacillus halophilus]PSL50598.1 Mn-containing catalase [Salsuginibacillus halophilus]